MLRVEQIKLALRAGRILEAGSERIDDQIGGRDPSILQGTESAQRSPEQLNRLTRSIDIAVSSGEPRVIEVIRRDGGKLWRQSSLANILEARALEVGNDVGGETAAC